MFSESLIEFLHECWVIIVSIYPVLIILAVVLVFTIVYSRKKRKKHKPNSNKPRTPKLYQNYLEKHKLDPLPDSLFRKTPPEGAHYNSNRWSTNPNLLNEKEYALFNEGKIDVFCPICDDFIVKERNPITKFSNYVCKNPSCNFTTMDFTNIKPLKYKEVQEKDVELIPCPDCDGFLRMEHLKPHEPPVYICSNFPDCRYGPLEMDILKANKEF